MHGYEARSRLPEPGLTRFGFGEILEKALKWTSPGVPVGTRRENETGTRAQNLFESLGFITILEGHFMDFRLRSELVKEFFQDEACVPSFSAQASVDNCDWGSHSRFHSLSGEMNCKM